MTFKGPEPWSSTSAPSPPPQPQVKPTQGRECVCVCVCVWVCVSEFGCLCGVGNNVYTSSLTGPTSLKVNGFHSFSLHGVCPATLLSTLQLKDTLCMHNSYVVNLTWLYECECVCVCVCL